MNKLTAIVYARIPLSSLSFGGCTADCTTVPLSINHTEDVGYKITITIPEGAKIVNTQFGGTLLEYADGTPDILRYHSGNNVVGTGTPTDRCCVPIRGVRIVKKIEI